MDGPCLAERFLPDVVPLPGMTPGVSQFYRRCLSAGAPRPDGTIICPSQKELALRLALSQGTVAAHLASLQALGLVVQRAPVVVLTSELVEAAQEERVSTTSATVYDEAISSLASVIKACAWSAAVAPMAEALRVLAAEREARREGADALVANSSRGIATNVYLSRESVASKSFQTKTEIEKEKESSSHSSSQTKTATVATIRDERASDVPEARAWSTDDFSVWVVQVSTAARCAGVADEYCRPGPSPVLTVACRPYSFAQMDHAINRLIGQLYEGKRKIDKPWGILTFAAQRGDPDYFPPKSFLGTYGNTEGQGLACTEAGTGPVDPAPARDPQDDEYQQALAEVRDMAGDPAMSATLAFLDEQVLVGLQKPLVPASMYEMFKLDPAPFRASKLLELARRS